MANDSADYILSSSSRGLW